MTNQEAAILFIELADLLDLAGELPFKSNSYRKVARSLNELEEPFDTIVKAGNWERIPGAGKAIKEKLTQLANAGKISALEKWRKHEIAAFYSWMTTLDLKPRPLGMLIRKLQASDFKDLLNKLNGYDIKKLTGQSRETAIKIIENK